ncbi:MAG: hypothetical protein QOE90_3093 [Thermoplasmata archaeon]|jgi:hypothetical protein|nr:hypothetical protein [Thermoplasmata archaeon]
MSRLALLALLALLLAPFVAAQAPEPTRVHVWVQMPSGPLTPGATTTMRGNVTLEPDALDAARDGVPITLRIARAPRFFDARLSPETITLRPGAYVATFELSVATAPDAPEGNAREVALQAIEGALPTRDAAQTEIQMGFVVARPPSPPAVETAATPRETPLGPAVLVVAALVAARLRRDGA